MARVYDEPAMAGSSNCFWKCHPVKGLRCRGREQRRERVSSSLAIESSSQPDTRSMQRVEESLDVFGQRRRVIAPRRLVRRILAVPRQGEHTKTIDELGRERVELGV